MSRRGPPLMLSEKQLRGKQLVEKAREEVRRELKASETVEEFDEKAMELEEEDRYDIATVEYVDALRREFFPGEAP